MMSTLCRRIALMGVVPNGWLVDLATAVVGALLLLSLLSLGRRSR